MRLRITALSLIAAASLMGLDKGCQPPDDDLDGDGWTTTLGDCDDSDPTVNPAAAELCDGLDNDCDGVVDNDPEGAPLWFADDDGDGFGDTDQSMAACEAPEGYVASGRDCDDSNALVYPGAEEACGDGLDNDCDGQVDEDGRSDWYADNDGDGWGAGAPMLTCSPPNGYVSQNGDCNDRDPSINPDAEEICDAIDQDCDGSIDDDATDAPTWFADRDSDGYGDGSTTETSCQLPRGYTDNAEDCDDTDASTHPGAPEFCDNLDNDCDGVVDEDAVDTQAFFVDADGDGYGSNDQASFCGRVPPAGYVTNPDDCDDKDAAVNPSAEEVCDAQDNNCDGETDEGYDADNDGWTVCGGDCDDADPMANPAATEIKDGVDNDCDGIIDESSTGCATSNTPPNALAGLAMMMMVGLGLRRRRTLR